MSKLIIACLAMAVAVFAFDTYHTQNRFSHLIDRMNGIEAHFLSIEDDIVSLAAVYRDHIELDADGANYHFDNSLGSVYDSGVDNEKQNTVAEEAQAVEHSRNDAVDSVYPVIEKVKETGYVNKEIWNTVEQEIKDMDARQSKIFWEEMLGMIQNNQIELYMDQ